MKRTNSIVECIGLSLLFLMSACDMSTPPSNSSVVSVEKCITDCQLRDLKNPDEISEECATCMMATFRDHHSQFPHYGNRDTVRGFKLRHEELKEMLTAMGGNADAYSVYAMFAVRDTIDESGYDYQVPELVFVVEKDGKSLVQQVSSNEREFLNDGKTFFDFTRPCPTICPN